MGLLSVLINNFLVKKKNNLLKIKRSYVDYGDDNNLIGTISSYFSRIRLANGVSLEEMKKTNMILSNNGLINN